MVEESSLLDTLRDIGHKYSKGVDAAVKCIDDITDIFKDEIASGPFRDKAAALTIANVVYVVEIIVHTPGRQFQEVLEQELNRQSRNHRIDAVGDQYCKLLWRLRKDLLLPEGAGDAIAAVFRAESKLLKAFLALLVRLDPSCSAKRRLEDYAVYRGLFVAVNPDAHQVWLAIQDFRAAMDCYSDLAFPQNLRDYFVWFDKRLQGISRHYAVYRFFEVLAHMRTYGSSEYEHMPQSDRANFREIVRGRELFNYVEDCK